MAHLNQTTNKQMTMKLLGKVAVITGTSPNIGGGLAEALAAEGATIAAVDANANNAADCAAYINKIGGKARGFVCDVCDDTEVASTVQNIVDHFGRIDILVNNAGYFNFKGVVDMPFDEWKSQTSVLLDGAFLFTKYVAKVMIQKAAGGSMINIISTAGHQGEPGNIAYGTAKAGLLNFTRSAAMELAKHQIRMNSLTPTGTDPSESYDRAERWGRSVERPGPDPRFEYAVSQLPWHRLPTPADYGRAVVFLASEDAEMITGADLRVDGGALAKYWAWNPAQEKSVFGA
jgi:NAD(P)-dependent dehydrogenase (short-subunit alcohol dehydrogenase family)